MKRLIVKTNLPWFRIWILMLVLLFLGFFLVAFNSSTAQENSENKYPTKAKKETLKNIRIR